MQRLFKNTSKQAFNFFYTYNVDRQKNTQIMILYKSRIVGNTAHCVLYIHYASRCLENPKINQQLYYLVSQSKQKVNRPTTVDNSLNYYTNLSLKLSMLMYVFWMSIFWQENLQISASLHFVRNPRKINILQTNKRSRISQSNNEQFTY